MSALRLCHRCGVGVHIRSSRCGACGVGLRAGRRRQSGTTRDAGYNVSTSGGRPQGTSRAAGYASSEGRPRGTSRAAGYATSQGRPEGTTRDAGYSVGISGGRPEGTTRDAGYCKQGGCHARWEWESMLFEGCDLPAEWDTSEEFLNVPDDLIQQCRRRIREQRLYDQRALATHMCWQCGKVLSGEGDTYRVNPPPHVDPDNAPAVAFKRAVEHCSLEFEDEVKDKWYACSYCRSRHVPNQELVGDVFNNGQLKPVAEWDMSQPEPLAALRNRYESTQIALCGLYSTTVKQASFAQWKHVQGEVNAAQKQDRHFYGLFGFLACKEYDIMKFSTQPEVALRIHRALLWLRAHNHLYSDFFSNYETLFRYVRPGFINPEMLEKQNVALDVLLEDEAVGMAFPVDSRYFDNFPLIFEQKDVAGVQHPHPGTQCREHLHQLTAAKYGEKYLEPKTFPHLHPWGFGGWHYECPMGFSPHIKMRLFDVRGWWGTDPCYPFFKYDYMTKQRLRAYNQRRVVKVGQLAEKLNASTVRQAQAASDPNEMYGSEIPR